MLELHSTESSTMTTKSSKSRQQTNELSYNDISATNRENKDNLWYTFHKKSRYTKEKCWNLHWKPATSSKNCG